MCSILFALQSKITFPKANKQYASCMKLGMWEKAEIHKE